MIDGPRNDDELKAAVQRSLAAGRLVLEEWAKDLDDGIGLGRPR
jgi:hypothetical protein